MRSIFRFALLAAAVCSCNAVSAADESGPWPQWRGPNRDDLSKETGLLQDWNGSSPTLKWTYRDAGTGYSGPAIVGETLYSMGADGKGEFAFALNVRDGKQIWKKPLAKLLRNNWGDGPRSTPTFAQGSLYVLTGVGDLLCLDPASGETKWKKSLTADFGGKVPGWGYCESPLVDGDKVVVTPGGANCVVALDAKTGDTVWKSTGTRDGAAYSSLVVATVGDFRMYVTQTDKHLIGVDAKSGKVLWQFGEIGRRVAVIPTPVVDGDKVFATAGYGAGCEMVKLTASGSGVSAEKVYVNDNIVNHHGGVILKDGSIFGHSDKGGWKCLDLNTGEVKWAKGREVGKGAIAYADNRFYLYEERTGKLTLLAASDKGWEPHGSISLPEETKLDRKQGQIWTHPVIADGHLYLRDQDLVFCFDVRKK